MRVSSQLERIYRAAGTFIEYNLLYFIRNFYLFIYLFLVFFLLTCLVDLCVFFSFSLLLSSFYLLGIGGIGGRRNSRSDGRRGRPLFPPLAAPPNRIKRSTSYAIRMPLNRCSVLLLRIFLQRSRRHVHFTLYSRADLDIPFFFLVIPPPPICPSNAYRNYYLLFFVHLFFACVHYALYTRTDVYIGIRTDLFIQEGTERERENVICFDESKHIEQTFAYSSIFNFIFFFVFYFKFSLCVLTWKISESSSYQARAQPSQMCQYEKFIISDDRSIIWSPKLMK